MADMLRHHNDTWDAIATFTRSDGSARDITNCTFLMTVNRVARPTNTADQMFETEGSVLGDPLNGQASFPIEIIDTGKYFYNIQLTEADGETVRTPLSGAYVVLQDITKPFFSFDVLLDDFGVDDTEIIVTGENSIWATDYITTKMDLDNSRLIAGTRDTRRVVRWYHPVDHAESDPVCDLRLMGDRAPKINFNPFLENVEFTILGYVDQGSINFEFKSGGMVTWYGGGVGHASGTGSYVNTGGICSMPDPVADTFLIDQVDLGGDPGWYYVKLWFEKGWASVNSRAWALGDDEPDVWQATVTPVLFPSIPWSIAVFGDMGAPVTADMIAEIAEFSCRAWK